jgi:PleD family two-component response regulator
LTLHREGDDVQSLLKRADQAMYRAKSVGRNCVVED